MKCATWPQEPHGHVRAATKIAAASLNIGRRADQNASVGASREMRVKDRWRVVFRLASAFSLSDAYFGLTALGWLRGSSFGLT